MVLKILLVNFISVYEKNQQATIALKKLPRMQNQSALISEFNAVKKGTYAYK